MADLYITQEEYDDLVEELVLKVADDHYDFDTILCLARGGMRVGDVFSRVHDMPLAILAASSYRKAAGTEQGELDIAQFITKIIVNSSPIIRGFISPLSAMTRWGSNVYVNTASIPIS